MREKRVLTPNQQRTSFSLRNSKFKHCSLRGNRVGGTLDKDNKFLFFFTLKYEGILTYNKNTFILKNWNGHV